MPTQKDADVGQIWRSQAPEIQPVAIERMLARSFQSTVS